MTIKFHRANKAENAVQSQAARVNYLIKLLKKHKSKLTKLAELLLEKEVIFKEDLLAIFGPRPWDKEEIKEEKPKPKKRKAKSKKDESKQVDNAGEDK